MVTFIVSTPLDPSPRDVEIASAEAERLQVACAPRRGSSVARLLEESRVRAAFVVGEREAAVWMHGHRAPLRFHGALGIPRARHLAAGGRDALADACGLRPGDRVIDATAGRCADALVLEAAVGPSGEVVALESSPLLHAAMQLGLRRRGSRIRLERAEHLAWLRAQPDASADVVYFDPMFRSPRRCQQDFDLLRELADDRPLGAEALLHAARVARRRVVVLDGPGGGELARLGLRDVTPGRWASRRIGVLPA